MLSVLLLERTPKVLRTSHQPVKCTIQFRIERWLCLCSIQPRTCHKAEDDSISCIHVPTLLTYLRFEAYQPRNWVDCSLVQHNENLHTIIMGSATVLARIVRRHPKANPMDMQPIILRKAVNTIAMLMPSNCWSCVGSFAILAVSVPDELNVHNKPLVSITWVLKLIRLKINEFGKKDSRNWVRLTCPRGHRSWLALPEQTRSTLVCRLGLCWRQ
jgi:hypothetical protein